PGIFYWVCVTCSPANNTSSVKRCGDCESGDMKMRRMRKCQSHMLFFCLLLERAPETEARLP
ncbi:hypothetical protein BaRGS_00009790, partial [Batillaria attramentaria]